MTMRLLVPSYVYLPGEGLNLGVGEVIPATIGLGSHILCDGWIFVAIMTYP